MSWQFSSTWKFIYQQSGKWPLTLLDLRVCKCYWNKNESTCLSHKTLFFFFVEMFVSAAELLVSVMPASSFINASSLSHYHFRFLLQITLYKQSFVPFTQFTTSKMESSSVNLITYKRDICAYLHSGGFYSWLKNFVLKLPVLMQTS